MELRRALLPSRRFCLRYCRRHGSGGTRVAIVGSGPSGMFACISLLRRLPWVHVDVLEASPVPFGLVRYGVAPDHQDVKNCIHSFEKMFESHGDRVRLFCNLRIGDGNKQNYVRGTQLPSLLMVQRGPGHFLFLAHLHAMASEGTRRDNVSLSVMSGWNVVSWYSGWPHAQAPLLDHPKAVIIGNGNVALDCARVLARADALRNTDVPDSALALLRSSRVHHIDILGRRGPDCVAFTIKELREQFRLDGWSTKVEMSEEERSNLTASLDTMDRPRKRLMQVLLDNIGVPIGDKRCSLQFRQIPKEILSDSSGRVRSLVVQTADGSLREIEAGLVVASLGFDPILLDGLPSNPKGGLLMHDEFRVAMPNDGGAVFAAGWCVGGARGVIADSQSAGSRAAAAVAQAIQQGADDSGVEELTQKRGIPCTGWEEWKEIDAFERAEGAKRGKIREKRTEFDK